MANYTDDETAIYDISRHHYTLTKAALEDKGLTVDGAFSDPDRDIPAFLRRVSAEGYSALTLGVQNQDATLYWLSLSENRSAMIDYLAEVGYEMMTYRTEQAADPSGKSETVALFARRLAMASGLYFRGTLDQTLVPYDFMDKKGVDW
jgi:hypothetical protein